MEIWFTDFENEKWNENALISRSRMKSEMKMSQNRDREWKVNWKCLEIEIEKWNFSRIFEKFWEILENQEIKKISNFVTNAFHLANFYSGIQQNAISESICHRGFWGWSLVETCMAVWMASFYWHRRTAPIAEVRPEVHPIHPVQSTYGFWTFKPVYTYFRSIWASQLQSMAVWSLLNFFIIITLTRIVFKKRISIMKLLHFCVIHDQIFWIFHDKTCIIHSFFSRKRVKSEMLSLFSRNEKWICFSFHSFREWKVKWKCLEIEIESESEMKMPRDRDREVK